MFVVINTSRDLDDGANTTAKAFPKIYPTHQAAVEAIQADAQETWKELTELLENPDEAGEVGDISTSDPNEFYLVVEDGDLFEEWTIQEVVLS